MHPRYKWLSDWLYYFVVLPVTALLPATLGIAMARRRGRHFARIGPGRRGRIEHALAGVITPDASALAVAAFEHEAAEELDTFYYRFWTPGTVDKTFTFEGLENLDQALVAGKGAVLVTAHLGSFCGAVVALGARNYRLNYLAHNSPNDPTFSPAFRRYARFKIRHMEKSSRRPMVLLDLGTPERAHREAGLAAFSVLDRLRDNELVSVAFDVAPQLAHNTSEVSFLGQSCRFPTGFLRVARLNQSPVIPYVSLREEGDWNRHRIVIHAPIEMTGDTAIDLQHAVEPIEKAIRQHPAQWQGWAALEEFAQG